MQDSHLAGELLLELADVLEVLQALAGVHGMSWEDVVSEACRKRVSFCGPTGSVLGLPGLNGAGKPLMKPRANGRAPAAQSYAIDEKDLRM
jgi:hypothetical protein